MADKITSIQTPTVQINAAFKTENDSTKRLPVLLAGFSDSEKGDYRVEAMVFHRVKKAWYRARELPGFLGCELDDARVDWSSMSVFSDVDSFMRVDSSAGISGSSQRFSSQDSSSQNVSSRDLEEEFDRNSEELFSKLEKDLPSSSSNNFSSEKKSFVDDSSSDSQSTSSSHRFSRF